jgi:hypothetical protein
MGGTLHAGRTAAPPNTNESTFTVSQPTKTAGRAGRRLRGHVIRLEQALSTTGAHPVGSVHLPVAGAERPGWWGRSVGRPAVTFSRPGVSRSRFRIVYAEFEPSTQVDRLDRWVVASKKVVSCGPIGLSTGRGARPGFANSPQHSYLLTAASQPSLRLRRIKLF